MTEMLIVSLLTVCIALMFAPRRRGGVGVNDLSRWKQYGGTLDRPRSPGRSRAPVVSEEDVA